MDQAMERVVATLRASFPAVAEGHVRDCVARIHATLEGARVRAYIPILVAREAAEELAAMRPAHAVSP